MKFTCLSGNPNSPCNLIKFKSTVIMLDCALDQSSLCTFLPLPLVHSNHFNSLPSWNPPKDLNNLILENELKEYNGKVFVDSSPEFSLPDLENVNLKHVDVILISNYRSMLALPYITERTEFAGFVYATEPSIILGRLYMEELVTYIERNPKLKQATLWKNSNVYNQLQLPENVLSQNLKTIYTMQEINSCMSKVKSVAFSEKISIFGSLQWYPVSSGYCIGSSNWVIESAHEKIVYMSASSALTTYPRYLETQPLKNSDVLILTSLSLTPHAALKTQNQNLSDFCICIEKCLKGFGNVLVPSYPTGAFYDQLECLVMHLDQAGLASVPIYFISPIADHSLAYSNILAEWLSEDKQKRVYVPEEPFSHATYIRNHRVKHFSSLSEEAFNNDFRTPCVVFTGHPSLRFGDVVHFIELWASSPNNMIVMTAPEFPSFEALQPYQPLAMKVVFCPTDTRLTFAQATKIIRDLKPANIVLPHQYSSSTNGRGSTDMIVESDAQMFSYKRNDVIKLPIKCKYERLFIDNELASQISPVEIEPGLRIATITGVLEAKDNKFRLCPITKSYQLEYNNHSPTKTLPPQKYLFGKIDVNMLINLLTNSGINDVVVDTVNDRLCIKIQAKGALVEIEENSTTIVTDQWNSDFRMTLRAMIAKCLISI